jgi:hypothetical protein
MRTHQFYRPNKDGEVITKGTIRGTCLVCGKTNVGDGGECPGEMSLAEMEKVALRIRPTSWQRVLEDD